MDGLRERKKRRTREDIAAAAMALFEARGFDSVTVAEIARAADVSEKTVFNYFPAKEDLIAHRGVERLEHLIAAVRALPVGTSPLEPFRGRTMGFLDRIEREPIESTIAVPRIVMGSTALRERLSVAWEQQAAALTPVIAEQAGLPPDDLLAAVIVRSLSWTHLLVFRAAISRLLDGEDKHAVAASLRIDATRAYDQLERGFGNATAGEPPVSRDAWRA
jgi:AcrR family transcriptional regulator